MVALLRFVQTYGLTKREPPIKRSRNVYRTSKDYRKNGIFSS